MKAPLAFALALSWLSAVAAPASAASFSPSNTQFTLSGPIQFQFGTVFISCRVVMVGVTSIGSSAGAMINAVTIAPSGNPLCATIRTNNLPWMVAPVGPTQLAFQLTNFSSPFGNCLGAVPATLSSGLVTLNAALPPNCVMTGFNLVTSPTLSIVYP
jgi:hypothetical protein